MLSSSVLKMDAACYSEDLVIAKLHDVMFQKKNSVRIVTVLRTLNLK
jgi:hypothetical protein